VPISATNPFKGRQYPGEVMLQAVRWYLRSPLKYEHVAELLAERGIEVDASCIWRWVQAYSSELSKRRRPHLKRMNKSYRVDETYIKVKGQDKSSLAAKEVSWNCYTVGVRVWTCTEEERV
jgi:transposase, IS6 family